MLATCPTLSFVNPSVVSSKTSAKLAQSKEKRTDNSRQFTLVFRDARRQLRVERKKESCIVRPCKTSIKMTAGYKRGITVTFTRHLKTQ